MILKMVFEGEEEMYCVRAWTTEMKGDVCTPTGRRGMYVMAVGSVIPRRFVRSNAWQKTFDAAVGCSWASEVDWPGGRGLRCCSGSPNLPSSAPPKRKNSRLQHMNDAST